LLLAARTARERAGLPPAREDAASTDANAALGRGIPGLTVGITTGGNAHRLDEFIDLAPVGDGLRALTALADELVVVG
jgi:di/tripeptidase